MSAKKSPTAGPCIGLPWLLCYFLHLQQLYDNNNNKNKVFILLKYMNNMQNISNSNRDGLSETLKRSTILATHNN